MSNHLHFTRAGLLQLSAREFVERAGCRSPNATGRRIEEAAPPALPHGEGLGFDRDPIDTLPQPRCEECKDRILYEDGIWWHAELVLDYDHAAAPQTIA